MKFGILYRKLLKLRTPLIPIMADVFSDSDIQEKMIELNQSQLMDKHVIGDGTAITTNYSKTSQIVYGKPNGPITLYDTGAFYDSMKVTSEAKDAFVSGDTIKQVQDYKDSGLTKDISEYVGGNQMGLTKDSINEL